MQRIMGARSPKECSVCNRDISRSTLYVFDGETLMRYCKECWDAADPTDWDKLLELSRTANIGM